MTDPGPTEPGPRDPGPTSSGLTPEQDAVRRLLASARHDEPVPEAVVARLDATLAELTADRRADGAEAPVVDLAARRRRRAGAGLLAAAAVVVAGVAVGQALRTDAGGDESVSAGESVRDSEQPVDPGAAAGDESLTDREAGTSAPAPKSQFQDQPGEELGTSYAAALTSGPELRNTLRDLRDADLPQVSSFEALPPPAEPSCLTTDVGRGRTVWVTYDDAPAIAVFRSPSGARQQAEVWLCGATSPETTLSLRAP